MTLSEKHRKALEAIAKHEAGERAFVNTPDAEECEDLGLIEKEGPDRYVLTAMGRSALKS